MCLLLLLLLVLLFLVLISVSIVIIFVDMVFVGIVDTVFVFYRSPFWYFKTCCETFVQFGRWKCRSLNHMHNSLDLKSWKLTASIINNAVTLATLKCKILSTFFIENTSLWRLVIGTGPGYRLDVIGLFFLLEIPKNIYNLLLKYSAFSRKSEYNNNNMFGKNIVLLFQLKYEIQQCINFKAF